MKKVLAFILVMVMLFLLAACGKTENVKPITRIPKISEEEKAMLWYRENKNSIFDGIYIVGKDIYDGIYSIESNNEDSSMEIAVFECIDDYMKYFVSDRFSTKDETDAIEKYASKSFVVYMDKKSLSLKNGNVLKIGDGKTERYILTNMT